MKRYFVLATTMLAVVTLISVQSANAQSVNFWFTRAGDTTPINAINASLGSSFNLSVWCQTTDIVTNEMNILVGFDTTSGYGVEAVPSDNKIVFGASGTAQNYTGSITKYAGVTQWDNVWENAGGGTARTGQTVRPYGYDVSFSKMSSTLDYSTPAKLFDISLKNVGVSAGADYWIELWNAGTGYGGTTYVYDPVADADSRDGMAAIYNPASWAGNGTGWGVRVYNTAPVPEPSGMMALFTGIVGIAGIALRRRGIRL